MARILPSFVKPTCRATPANHQMTRSILAPLLAIRNGFVGLCCRIHCHGIEQDCKKATFCQLELPRDTSSFSFPNAASDWLCQQPFQNLMRCLINPGDSAWALWLPLCPPMPTCACLLFSCTALQNQVQHAHQSPASISGCSLQPTQDNR